VNTRPILLALLVASLVLIAAAWLRSAEYDEQYTLFLTAGHARPVWPTDVLTAGDVQTMQSGHAGLAAIAHDLRATDVHPPLYFWVVATWRGLAGNNLFIARLASVMFSIGTLCAVAAIARLAAIPAVMAVLVTLGCYGFVYTGTIARGFALAQMLTASGIALLLFAAPRRRAGLLLVAGTLLGAATFANYLAAFVGIAALLWLVSHVAYDRMARVRCLVCVGFALWLPADLWFFLAQRQGREGQFSPFDAAVAALRLAQYLAASVFGGLPLYVNGAARTAVASALAALLAGLIALTIRYWRRIATPELRTLLAMAAAAPPIGLLLLGVMFDTTPIELRYLAYTTPFVGLLLAATFAALPRHRGHLLYGLLLTIQAAAVVGLLTRPETMQPARETAAAAASLVHDGVVLLPRGNDGIGIVGAFAGEAPPTLRLLVVGSDESSAQIRKRSEGFPRVVLALLGQDPVSRSVLPTMRQAFVDPCWWKSGEAFNVLVFDQICGEACPCSLEASR
jgi:hypothetical protein